MSAQQVIPVTLKTNEGSFLFKAPPSEKAVIGIDIQNTHNADSYVELHVARAGVDKLNPEKATVIKVEKGVTRKRGNIHIPPGYSLIAITKYPSQITRIYSPNLYTDPGRVTIKPGKFENVEVHLRNLTGEHLVRAVTKSIGYTISPTEAVVSQGNPAHFKVIKDDISETDGQVMFVIDELKAATILDVELFKENEGPEFVWRDSMMADIYKFARDTTAK